MPRTYAEAEQVVLDYVRSQARKGEPDASMPRIATQLNAQLPRDRAWTEQDARSISYSLIGTGELRRCIGSYRELHVAPR